MFDFQRKRSEALLLESIYDKFLEHTRSTKTTGHERSLSLHTYMALQQNKEWGGSTLPYSLTKQKMEWSCSVCRTYNKIGLCPCVATKVKKLYET
jgi:hypothetical protein